jgi:hypothetical protein
LQMQNNLIARLSVSPVAVLQISFQPFPGVMP